MFSFVYRKSSFVVVVVVVTIYCFSSFLFCFLLEKQNEFLVFTFRSH